MGGGFGHRWFEVFFGRGFEFWGWPMRWVGLVGEFLIVENPL